MLVHDRNTGIVTRVSVDGAGNEARGTSGGPSISANGRFVAFNSNASNLVPGDTNALIDVFVHDRKTGATTRVGIGAAGASLSATGRFVAFYGDDQPNAGPGDPTRAIGVFVHDRRTGLTTRVSVDSAGNQANADSVLPSITASGRAVAYASEASNLVTDDTNQASDVFVHDLGGHGRFGASEDDEEGDDDDEADDAD